MELVAGTNQIFFPNGLAFDNVGNLRLTESVSMGSSGPGRAMLRVGLDKSWHGSRTLENRDLKALLGERLHR